ncbi:hypothetical protein DXG01_006352 [Tephrocybe rancida]|nr:hypothetical protein DXG01_006352 [Tephrocybe rancida]
MAKSSAVVVYEGNDSDKAKKVLVDIWVLQGEKEYFDLEWTTPEPVCYEAGKENCFLPANYATKMGQPEPVVEKDCIIYGLSTIMSTKIQLQECPICHGQYGHWIGLETRARGILNLNNKMLFMHDLLEDYTSLYTSSETPFAAWAKVVDRQYGNNMTCAKCGEAPEDMIWDGVTVGFSKKHVLDTLHPPTISHEDTPLELNEYNAKQQDVGEGKKKKKQDTAKKDEAAKKAEVDRLEDVPHVLIKLCKISVPLTAVFDEHFGVAANYNKVAVIKVYQDLFVQIAAEESILQMINKEVEAAIGV